CARGPHCSDSDCSSLGAFDFW
nr:immunoglobulin heavy chain junction region [Macaca mulatta]